MTKFREYDLVKLIDDTEIEPAYWFKKGAIGMVVDTCFPGYYKVKFQEGFYWVNGCRLEKVK